MLAGFTEKRPELLARAVRDNLADCLVTLPTLIERRAWASLHLWFAGFDGLRRELFPALAAAIPKVGADGTASECQTLIAQGAEHWLQLARRLPTLDLLAIEQLSHTPELVAL
jgi:hypothetical protein